MKKKTKKQELVAGPHLLPSVSNLTILAQALENLKNLHHNGLSLTKVYNV